MRFLNFRYQLACKLFIWIIFFGFLVCGPATATEVIDRVVAVVNGEMVSLYELNQRIEPFVEKIKNSGYSLADQRPMLFQLRETKLREIIDEKLADQEIERLDIDVREADVDDAIERFKAANRLNDKSLNESLLLQGVTVAAFRDRIRKQLLRVKLVNREVRTKIVITDEDVAQYYRAHTAEYGAETRYHLKNILKVIPSKPGAEQSDLKAQVYKELKEIRRSIYSIADFENAAKMHSDAPNSDDGGEIGTISLSALSLPIREAVLALGPGEISPIIATDQGYQIFQLVDLVQASGEPLEKVKEQIREKLFQEQVNQAYGNWLEDLYKRAYIKRLP